MEDQHRIEVDERFSDLENDQPQRKKRCLRFASDLSEDPLLVSADSGFGDLTTGKLETHHGGEGTSFFLHHHHRGQEIYQESTGLSSILCGPHLRTSSVDTEASLQTELSELPDTEGDLLDDQEPEKSNKEQVLNFSNNSTESGPSDPCYTSGGSSSRSTSSASGGVTSSEDSLEQYFGSTKDFGDSRSAMLQRFFTHIKNNPNDSQLQHFLNLLLAGPEFSLPRSRLRQYTTINDAIRLLRCSKRVLVLSGAGISVSCGIPDFRSKDGLYSRVSKVFPDLRDPQSVFDIRLFRKDPRPFFLTAKELYPGQFEASLSHKFIRKLEERGQLLRNYSQNIDTLERIAGIDKVTMCHGSFATATCLRCKYKVLAEEIKEKVLKGEVPFCPNCSDRQETDQIVFPLGNNPNPISTSSTSINLNTTPSTSQESGQSGSQTDRRLSFEDDDEEELFRFKEDTLPLPPVLKPDIVFFGEDLPDEFHNNLQNDKTECDLLLVIGSSLRVRPVSLIPGMLPSEVPQILINRESLGHCSFDIELLGNCDAIISHLCRSLGTEFNEFTSNLLEEIEKSKLPGVRGRGNTETEKQEEEHPKSEHDIQALKLCWEPKINEKISDKLPENTYLNWKTRQYIFEGAELVFDPDEDDDDDDSSSDSSISDNESSISNLVYEKKENDDNVKIKKETSENN